MEPRSSDAVFLIRIALGLIVSILLVRQYSLLTVGSEYSIIPLSVEDQPTIGKTPIPSTDALNIIRDLKTGSDEDAAKDMNVDSKGGELGPPIPRQNQTVTSNLYRQRYSIPKEMIPNLDMDSFEKFQAEIDRRLPLWQEEAAKEDGIQDPPNVKKYDGVVLVTKVHSPGRDSINQMICLQKAAYNHRRNYPWVIFHTAPVTAQQVAEANALAYPGTVTFVQDSPPLEEVVGNLSKEEQDYLINRCQCCDPKVKTSCCMDPSKKIDWGFWW